MRKRDLSLTPRIEDKRDKKAVPHLFISACQK